MTDCYASRPDRRPPHGLALAVVGETFVVAALPEFHESPADARRRRRPSRLWRALRRLAWSRSSKTVE